MRGREAEAEAEAETAQPGGSHTHITDRDIYTLGIAPLASDRGTAAQVRRPASSVLLPRCISSSTYLRQVMFASNV